MKSAQLKNICYLLLILVFVYILLFEFILPINRVLPRPSILVESFIHLWTFYNLGIAITSTVGVVYISIFVGYIIIWLGRGFIIKNLVRFENSILTMRLFRNFQVFFVIILFTFWFANSLTAQFCFAVLAFIFMVIRSINKKIPSVKKEYIETALNLNPGKLYPEIYWHSILPFLFDDLIRIHYYLWMLVIIYEFISNSFGLGEMYRMILNYNDFGALIAIAVIISIIIWLGSCLIRFTKNKLAFWES